MSILYYTMITKQDLVSEISDYVTRAQGLETTRQALVDRVLGVVKTQIIPELTPLLPRGYSIDTDRTEIVGVGGERSDLDIRNLPQGSVPTGFGVSLRLLYDGRPIGFHDKASNGVGNIQRDLKPKLDELARAYNLDSIIPFGEPIQM